MWKLKKREKGMKGRIWPFLLLLFLGLMTAGSLFWQNYSRKAQKASAQAEIKTAEVIRGNLVSELTSSGTISPKNTYDITSLVEGEVISANFEEGNQVEEGQILYQLDVSSMDSDLNSAVNSLERANKSYQQALNEYQEIAADYSGNTYKSTRSGFISTLNIAQGDKVGANTELASLYNDQTMKLKLPFLSVEVVGISAGSQGVITLSDTGEQLNGVVTGISSMDEVLDGGRLVRTVTLETSNPGGLTTNHSASVAIGAYTSAGEGVFEPSTDTVLKADLSGSVTIEALLVQEGDYVSVGTPLFRMNAGDTEKLIRSYENAVDSAKEKIESAQSKVDTTQNTYKNYTITAPISGQVIKKTVKVGDNISRSSGSGSTVMAVIYDLSQMIFEMSVDELDVRNVKVGQQVEITADAIEGKTFQGTVTNVSLESSQSNGVTNYPVTVTIEEVGELLPGMNVDGRIMLDQVENTLMIPVDALMRGNRVYVKDDTVTEPQGQVPAGFRSVEVETGLTSDIYVEITRGLSEGNQIYINESSQGTQSFMIPAGNMGGMGGPPSDMGGSGAGRNAVNSGGR